MTGVASARVTSSAGVVSAGVVGAGVVGADGVGVVGAGVVSAGVVEADVKLMEAATVGLAGVVGMAEWFGLAGLAELVEWDGIAKLVGSKGPAGSVSGVRMVAGSPCETVVAGSVGSMCSVMGSTVAPLLFPPHIERPASPSIDQFDGTGRNKAGLRVGSSNRPTGWDEAGETIDQFDGTGRNGTGFRELPSTGPTGRDATGPIRGCFHRQARRNGTKRAVLSTGPTGRDATGPVRGRFHRQARRNGMPAGWFPGGTISQSDGTGHNRTRPRAPPSTGPTKRDATGGYVNRPI